MNSYRTSARHPRNRETGRINALMRRARANPRTTGFVYHYVYLAFMIISTNLQC